MYIDYGDREELVIEAEDNYIDYFETEIKNNVLHISMVPDIGITTKEKVKYYLTVKKIDYLATTSAGDINAPDITGSKLKVIVRSAGDIKLKNIDVGDLRINMSSAGDVTFGTFKGDDVPRNQQCR